MLPTGKIAKKSAGLFHSSEVLALTRFWHIFLFSFCCPFVTYFIPADYSGLNRVTDFRGE